MNAPVRAGAVIAAADPQNGATQRTTCRCGEQFTQQASFGVWLPTACPACERLEDAARIAREAEERGIAERQRRLAMLDVPLLYRDVTLDSFKLHGDGGDRQKQTRVLQLARRYIAEWGERQNFDSRFAQVVIFRGPPGTGKGHVAWSIAMAVVSTYGDGALVNTLADCVRDLRAAWRSSEGPTEAERLRRYRSVDLLVIDEVSRHAFYGEPTQHLYDLVAWREQRLLPTIITTNESADDLAKLIGPALESRAAGWSGVWDFGQADFRLERRRPLAVAR